MLPYWWASSLIRAHEVAMLSERKTPATPSTVPATKMAGYDWPGAAAPKPTLTALATAATLVKLAPELVEWNRPVSPVSQMSPSRPATALKCGLTVGRPVAAAVKLWPPLVLT